MFNKLKSQSGQFVTFFLVYPILILLVAYGILAFMQSTTTNTLIRKQYASMQAEYRAVKGLSYVFYEILDHAISNQSFVSHIVETDNSLTALSMMDFPVPSISTTRFSVGAIYGLKGPASTILPDFQAKIYTTVNSKGETTYFALVKGVAGDQIHLYFYKLEGSPLYEYMYFFPGDVDFGWQHTDALGAKIHANGNIRFNDSVRIDNVSEFSTTGKFSWQFIPFVHSSDEASNVYFNRRWPFVAPAEYDSGYPGTGNYVNSLDGHIAGTRPGLILWDDRPFSPTQNTFVEYDPVNWATNHHYNPVYYNDPNPNVALRPIWPWGKGIPPAGYDNQYPNNLRRARYLENSLNCGSNCAVGVDGSGNLFFNLANNANLYEKSTKINGIYIPSMLNTGYPTKQFFGNHAGDGSYNVYATDSQLQASDWASFISAPQFQKVVNGQSVTGIYDSASPILKEASTGGERITPPRINVASLASSAANSGGSMIIRISDQTGEIQVKINGTDEYVVNPQTGYSNSCAPGEKLFEVKNFVNNKYAKPETMVVVNIGALMTCEAAAPGTQWLPTDKIISNVNTTLVDSGYKDIPVSLAITNAKTLPSGGLTYIVNGNLLFQGHYNYNPADPSQFQPSAAIVSNRVALVSDSFEYPTTLPMTQHHINYPASGDAFNLNGLEETGLPAGTGFDKDYSTADNINWLAKYDPEISTGAKMANKVRNGVINNGVGEYHYNVSLVGKYAVTPDLLEVWNYYDTPGTASTAPVANTWRENKAIVAGSFIQLEAADFPAYGSVPTVPFNRSCDGSNNNHVGKVFQINSDGTTLPFNNTRPCRNGLNPGNPWDLVAANEREEQRYEPRYQTNGFPPGNLNGFADAFVIRIPFNNDNWTHHLPSLL